MTKAERSYKVKVVAELLLIFVLLLAVIGITAYNSKIQYDINKLNNQISETQKEIQNLQVQIKTAANITNLESRATELGLMYPTSDQIVFLEAEEGGIEDFALALMESVYR
ncbi:MAG: cell division protein FtsL [Firmicutes bacterium]|jgi:cell division protein FtsL|nr:cell division protein FtsL [Bacillota bacterium]MBR0210673.1 cell division protein FtsL [Bacillota bacterium]MBR2099363.1 cell division protein FtsL [Bacillota bacterium]MBR3749877.1 cell division protein FtsL [Bacillota bacterium]MBR6969381.1 cell division protein FtsL [Bacillota bacterium]